MPGVAGQNGETLRRELPPVVHHLIICCFLRSKAPFVIPALPGAPAAAGETSPVSAGAGVRYALPQRVHRGEGGAEIFFRTDNVYKNCKVVAECGGRVLYSKKRMIVAPGEMEKITLDKSGIDGDVTVRLEI